MFPVMTPFLRLAIAAVCLALLPHAARGGEDLRSWETLAAAIPEARRVEIMGLMPSYAPPTLRLPDLTYIAGYEVVYAPRDVDPASAATLAAVLGERGYFTPGTPEARFLPAIALRFHGTKGQPLAVLVCFGCSTIGVAAPEGDEVTVFKMNERATGELLAIAKKLLPEDRGIQELP